MVKFYPSHSVFHNGMLMRPAEAPYDIDEDDVAELSQYGSVISSPVAKQTQETLFDESAEDADEETVAEPVKRKGGRPKKGESPLLATATKEDLSKL